METKPDSEERGVFAFDSIYRQKLTKQQEAVAMVPKKGNLAFGLGPSNPPALLAALADRVAAGDVEELHLYYQLASEGARPLFRTDFLDRLHFHCNFMTGLDRELIKEAGSSAAVDFMSCYLWQLPRVLTEFHHINILAPPNNLWVK